MTPLDLARAQETKITPCYSLVYAWLRANGVKETPTDSQSRRWWMDHGPEMGMALAAEFMGLKPSEGGAGDVAVFAQPGGPPVLGIVTDGGFGVVRSFGRLTVWKPKILRAWGLPWAR